MSYLATLEEKDMKISFWPPKDIQEVFKDYEDVISPEFLKQLSPRGKVDH